MGVRRFAHSPCPQAAILQEFQEGRDVSRINGALRPTAQYPVWSGVPVRVAEDLMVVLVHVADTRQVTPPANWRHTDFMETESGDVEVHLYRRTD